MDGEWYIYRNSPILEDHNLGNKARKELEKVMAEHAAPTELCDPAKGIVNTKLGVKAKDSQYLVDGAFQMHPMGTKDAEGKIIPNPFKFDPNKEQNHPLVTCLDPSSRKTGVELYKEVSQSLLNAGFDPKTGQPL